MEKQLNIILMGPPAAGKGTQSENICKKFNIAHISTGDMFRSAIASKTPLGVEASEYISAGKLVPDSLTIKLVEERLGRDDCLNGFLLDGFPRTIPQAEALDKLLEEGHRELSYVILLEADDEELASRITSRRVCPKCGASYSLKNKKPHIEGICDESGSKLIQRDDDKIESFKVRLDDYHSKTSPLADYYENKGKLVKIDALQDIDKVFEDIKKVLEA